VLSAYKTIEPLGWRVFVESAERAYTARAAICARRPPRRVLLLAVATSVYLAPGSSGPSSRSGCRSEDRLGRADQQIVVSSNDEPGAADEFNRMAAQLRESYAGLELKVEGALGALATALSGSTRRAASSKRRANTSRISWRTCRTSCGRR
jgi:hypothetical protein